MLLISQRLSETSEQCLSAKQGSIPTHSGSSFPLKMRPLAQSLLPKCGFRSSPTVLYKYMERVRQENRCEGLFLETAEYQPACHAGFSTFVAFAIERGKSGTRVHPASPKEVGEKRVHKRGRTMFSPS